MAAPEYQIKKVDQTPSLEGDLADSLWESIEPIELVNTVTGKKADLKTQVRMCWTDDALHVLFECDDTEIFAEMTKRDDPIYEQEVVELFIADGPNVPTRYLEFEVSPINTVWDGKIKNLVGNGSNIEGKPEWNAESFRSAVHIIPAPDKELPACAGWKARMSIGFNDLTEQTSHPEGGEIWRGNLYRIKRRPKEEFQAWSPLQKKPADFHVPMKFGIFTFAD